ncbi:2-dehydropantoate 2-reductase [Xylophilus rhododendri]|uniref:2-dehydropantoate 2-reductase n=1 Tax=Xylophilus rhododendri TaxID=2697032 RepID=A0A857JEM7_9BURK|nr:2-dehydropantoate 2-reductase [Xylophilus rhododendri]QHJ01249.1 2-dehydropantoate 2-reductase [Xylophilus rhododendri]
MRIAIVGAGAIGGLMGTRLAAAGGHEVSALARGATLQALRQHGWRLQEPEGALQAPAARLSDRTADLGEQDLIVIAVKAPALAEVAAQLAPMIGARTRILPAMNGVPWWFGQGIGGLDGQALQSVDPGGRIAAALPFSQVLACVVHASTSTPEPGLARRSMGNRLIVGEPQGGLSDRAEAVSRLLTQAGFDAPAVPDVRYHLWYKLWGNLTMNPITAITGATVDRVLDDPLARRFCADAMLEAQAVGERIGCAIAETPQDRHAVTRKLGAFKTSMLQDVEAGRAMELDGIVTAVHEIALRIGVATPNIDALLAMARLFGRSHGLYPAA